MKTQVSRWKVSGVLLALLMASAVAGEEDIKGTSFFDQEWLKALISIEVSADGITGKSIGSGFIVSTPGDHIALVTAKHVVFEKNGRQRDDLAYRINRKQGRSDLITEAHAAKYAPGGWLKSAEHDVACRLIVWGNDSELRSISYSRFLIKHRIEPGAPLFVIGFPMGLRSEEHATPILRSGTVARTDPDNILIDAFVFAGTSGGPVVYAPLTPVGGAITSPVLQGQWLLGLTVGYVPYVDVAISAQTERPRVTFEENSGLCNVVPASAILTLLESKEFVAVDMKKR